MPADGKRPNGLPWIPWHEDRSLTWDVTVCDTVAGTYLTDSLGEAGVIAEVAALRRSVNYGDVMQRHLGICSALSPLKRMDQFALRVVFFL